MKAPERVTVEALPARLTQCGHCKVYFAPERPRAAVYCSDRCRVAAARRRKRTAGVA